MRKYIPPTPTPPREANLTIKIPYTPQPHQRMWHECKTRFLVAVCGRQIGKTVASVNELIKRAILNPGTRNWYVTNDYRQAKRNVWDLFPRYIPKELGATYNNSDLVIRFPNGSKIELIGVENANSLRGAAVHFMILDEYADFPVNTWGEVLAPMFSTTNGSAWFMGTPKGFNHFYLLFQTDHPQWTKVRIPACEVKDGKIVKLTSQYAVTDIIQTAFDTSTEEAFAQEYLGEFTKPSGTVYKEWPLDHYMPIEYDPNLPLHISWDFGINDPTAIIWLQRQGGQFRVIDYYEASDGNIDHFIQVVRSKPYKSAELHTGDPAGKARAISTGLSPIEQLQNAGIFVRTKDGVKIQEQIAAAHKVVPSLYISSTNQNCYRFRECIVNYRYPQKDERLVNQSNEVPIHDQYSHAMRALEYYAVNVFDFDSIGDLQITGYETGLGGVKIPRYNI